METPEQQPHATLSSYVCHNVYLGRLNKLQLVK
jgi:hypothetical protein